MLRLSATLLAWVGCGPSVRNRCLGSPPGSTGTVVAEGQNPLPPPAAWHGQVVTWEAFNGGYEGRSCCRAHPGTYVVPELPCMLSLHFLSSITLPAPDRAPAQPAPAVPAEAAGVAMLATLPAPLRCARCMPGATQYCLGVMQPSHGLSVAPAPPVRNLQCTWLRFLFTYARGFLGLVGCGHSMSIVLRCTNLPMRFRFSLKSSARACSCEPLRWTQRTLGAGASGVAANLSCF